MPLIASFPVAVEGRHVLTAGSQILGMLPLASTSKFAA